MKRILAIALGVGALVLVVLWIGDTCAGGHWREVAEAKADSLKDVRELREADSLKVVEAARVADSLEARADSALVELERAHERADRVIRDAARRERVAVDAAELAGDSLDAILEVAIPDPELRELALDVHAEEKRQHLTVAERLREQRDGWAQLSARQDTTIFALRSSNTALGDQVAALERANEGLRREVRLEHERAEAWKREADPGLSWGDVKDTATKVGIGVLGGIALAEFAGGGD